MKARGDNKMDIRECEVRIEKLEKQNQELAKANIKLQETARKFSVDIAHLTEILRLRGININV